MARVSVIVNTVDRVEDLKRCLDRLLSQTFKDFEVVVVNNGQGEETSNLLEQKGIEFRSLNLDFKIVEDSTKKLPYLFNLGWKKSDPKSGYLAYLADDTEADPQYLAAAAFYLENHPEAAAVSGPVLSTSNPPGEMNYLYGLAQKNFFTKILLRIYEYFVMEEKIFEPGHWCQSGAFTLGAGIPQVQITSPIEVDLLTSTSLVIRREVLEKVGGFDENFLFNHADGDLFIRLKKLNYKLIFHPWVKVWHHMRFGPTRYPEILGRDTAFYFLKDVRPKSLRGWVGLAINLFVFNSYFVFKSVQTKNFNQLRGITGFVKGIFDFFRAKSLERNNLLGKILVVLGFLFIFGLALRKLWAYPMLSYGDATPFPNNFHEAFQFFFQAFDPRAPQGLNPQDGALLSTLVPLEAFLALVFGGNFVWAQKLFHLLPMPLSFITIYFFVAQFTQSRLARFLTAFIYSGNHFMVAEFAGGFEGNFYAVAFLPIFIWQLLKIYTAIEEKKSFRRIFLAYAGLLTLTYVLSDHIFLLLVPFWLIFILGPIFEKDFRRLLRNILVLTFSFLIILFLSADHASEYLRLVLPYALGKKFAEDVIPFFVTNVWDTYWQMTLGNILRLGGSYFVDFFKAGELWTRIGFAIPLLGLSWFLFRENRRGLRLRVGLFFTLALALDTFFVYLTSLGKTIPIMKTFPLLFRLRNPSRLMLLLAFFYVPLIGLTLDGWFCLVSSFWQRRLKIRLIFSLLMTLLVISGLVWYQKGFFAGDFTLQEHRGNNFYVTERYRQVGEFFRETRRNSQTPFRTAYFPWTHEETEVKLLWVDPYTFSLPITYGAYYRDDYFNVINSLYRQVAEGKSQNLGESLSVGGIKYIVLNSLSQEKGPSLFRSDYQTPWLLGSFEAVKKTVTTQKDLKFIKEIGGFEVYENLSFDWSRVDPGQAGLTPAAPFQNQLRKGLIALTFLSWLVWLFYLCRHEASTVRKL